MKRALALALLAAACGPRYDGVDVRLVEIVGESDVAVDVSRERITLPAGLAILIWLEPQSAHHGRYDYDEADILSQSDAIATIHPTGEGWQFLLVGADQGDTCIVIRLENVEEECLPVVVTP